MKEMIFDKLESMIKDVSVDTFNIYEICEEDEKLKLDDDYKSNTFSYKILNNKILLKYNMMKKVSDNIELKYIDETMLNSIKSKFKDVQHKQNDLYIKIGIEDINQLDLLRDEIKKIFNIMFLQYMSTEEAFGCCSKYMECSDSLHCVQNDTRYNIRLRFSCIYKKNLDSGKIFYGKNRNID